MTAIDDIAAERRRQIEVEGWAPEHDDLHRDGVLARAAACYAAPSYPLIGHTFLPMGWPWERAWWKPTTRRRDLVKAAALIVAEIERLDRQEGQAELQEYIAVTEALRAAAEDTAPMREATRDFKRLKPAHGKFYDAPLRGRR